MEFNRTRLMENINTLIKEKGLKIGEIETTVGISTGYLSKMTKTDNESMPGIDLIFKLAELLEVSVDALVGGDFNKSNDNLFFVMKFIQSLIEDTDIHKFTWEKFAVYNEVKEKYGLDELPMSTNTRNINLEKEISGYKFRSLFSEIESLILTKENYIGFVDNLGIVLFFKLRHGDEYEYELYVIDDNLEEKVISICSTLEGDGAVSPFMLDLYNCIIRHDRDIKVSETARNLMRRYMNNREIEELPFS